MAGHTNVSMNVALKAKNDEFYTLLTSIEKEMRYYCKGKKLSIRALSRWDGLAAYEKQGHKCAICGEEFEQIHADRITPWSKGRKNSARQLSEALPGL